MSLSCWLRKDKMLNRFSYLFRFKLDDWVETKLMSIASSNEFTLFAVGPNAWSVLTSFLLLKVDKWADAKPMKEERVHAVMTKVGRSSRWFVSSVDETTSEIWQDDAWSLGPDSESDDNLHWTAPDGSGGTPDNYYTNTLRFCQVALNDDAIFIGIALMLKKKIGIFFTFFTVSTT